MFKLISLHKNNTDIIANVMVKKLKVWLNNTLNKCYLKIQKILVVRGANQRVFRGGGIDILISGTTH